jgi:hypothetical protein
MRPSSPNARKDHIIEHLALDQMIFEKPATALCRLCLQFTGILKKAMLRQYYLGTQRTLVIHRS